MKKIITFLLFTAIALNMFAQYSNDQTNLEKYWYYRKRLQENFLYVNSNNVPGSNIPVDRLVPNTSLVNGEVVAGEINQVEWDDCNGALPYYIMLLATEYKLLKKYNHITDANLTLQELNRAVLAVRRLDTYADGIENGVFRRNDIKYVEPWTSRHPDTLGVWLPLVNYFDNKSGDFKEVSFNFAERFTYESWEKYPSTPSGIRATKENNIGKDKYNSIDNVIKFVEAEAIVRNLLSSEGSTAIAISNILKNSVKKMITNMYHPDEPRKTFNRNEIASGIGFLRRTWYLKDPDLSAYSPKNLIPEELGGAGDFYTYFTSYGLSKSAKKYDLTYKGTDLSDFFFKVIMQFKNLYQVKFYEVSYAYDNKIDTMVMFYGANNFTFTPDPCVRYFCGARTETLLSTVDFTLFDNSFWMIRSLAATNDISPYFIELFSPDNSTYNFLKNCGTQYSKVLEQYPLIWSVLNTKKFISNSDRAAIGLLLNSAPACGPYNFEHYDYNSDAWLYDFEVYDWSCPNRFVWPELNGSANKWKRSGYFNGIDYMLLHNLYWLTKVNQSEYDTTYVNEIIKNQNTSVNSKSQYDYARNSVKFQSGFKVTVSGDYQYKAGTNQNMRTAYDIVNDYYKVNVSNYASQCGCEPIFKDLLKSAYITNTKNTGVDDNVTINVFPNPGKEKVTVSCNESIQRVTLHSSTGKILYDYSGLSSESHTFVISNLPAGIYLVKTITNSGYEKVQKIIKSE